MHTAHYLQQFSLAIQDNRIDEALTITLQWQETQPDAMAFACEAMLHRKQNELRHAKKAIEKGLTELIEQTRSVWQQMTSSVADSEQAIERSEQAHQSFDEIANSVQLVQNFIAQIAEQAQQQGHAASETKHTISGVNDSAQHVGQAADNLSAGATQLVELANNLNRLVGRFDIN